MPFTSKAVDRSNVRTVVAQTVAVMVSNLSMMSLGMGAGFVTILIAGLSSKNDELYLTDGQISWIGAGPHIVLLIGNVLSGFITQRMGRKRSMQIMTVPMVLCWVTYKYANRIWQIYLILCIGCLVWGIVASPAQSYLVEIAQPHLRGMFSSTSWFSIIFGTFIPYSLGPFFNWRDVSLICSVVSIISLILLFFIPESPYWLLNNNKMEEGRKSLAWLRGWTNTENTKEEFLEICNNVNTNEAYDRKLKRISLLFIRLPDKNEFNKKSFLWPFSLVFVMNVLSHLTGATAFQTYAIKIFETFQIPLNTYQAVIYIGVAKLISCIIYTVFVPFYGKRVLTLVSLFGILVSNCVIATYAYLTGILYFNQNSVQQGSSFLVYDWISFVFFIILASSTSLGIGPISMILMAEVFTYQTRATGCGLSTAVSHILGFCANKFFFDMVTLLSLPGQFWLNASLSLFGYIVIYFVLPETEGKSLAEISNHFSGISKLDHHVKRPVNKKNFACNTNKAYDIEHTNKDDIVSKL